MVAACGGVNAEENRPPATVHLRTGGISVPIVIGGQRPRTITSVELKGEIGAEGGPGTVTLGESPIAYNEFGDATVVFAEATPTAVAFRRVEPSPRLGVAAGDRTHVDDGRRIYDVVLGEDYSPLRLRLVLAVGSVERHRLVAGRTRDSGGELSFQTTHVLDLTGTPAPPPGLADTPIGPDFNLAGLSSSVEAPTLGEVTLRGKAGGEVALHFDPNHIGFTDYGDIGFTTLIGSWPEKWSLTAIELQDPTGRGRRLYRFGPREPSRPLGELESAYPRIDYRLVLAPTAGGDHRLIIRKDGRIDHVLAMHEPDRRRHYRLDWRLAEVSPEERGAIAGLRAKTETGFDFTIDGGRITRLTVTGARAEEVDAALQGLKNLEHLELREVPLGPTGLANLKNLARLESLFVGRAPVDDGALGPIGGVTGLRVLALRGCPGITDEGLSRLAGLKQLTHLILYREDLLRGAAPEVPLVTDAGLKHVAGMTSLTDLNLMGQRITDDGLRHLSGLTALTSLAVSGRGVTDGGLRHLEGLENLRWLNLYETGVTDPGRKRLKAALPKLNL